MVGRRYYYTKSGLWEGHSQLGSQWHNYKHGQQQIYSGQNNQMGTISENKWWFSDDYCGMMVDSVWGYL